MSLDPEDYKIIIPIVNDQVGFENCLKSIDVNWRKHLIIIDNSKDSFCRKYETSGALIYYFPENIGVARSWNIGLSTRADWVFVVSSNVVFPVGFSKVADILKEEGSEYFRPTQLWFHCNAISRKTVSGIGYFDENFYPAYYEDADYYYRMRVSDIEGIKSLTKIFNEAHACTTRQATAIQHGLSVNFLGLGDYYCEKWGGLPGFETFKLPFGDKPIDFWIRETISHLKIKYKLEE